MRKQEKELHFLYLLFMFIFFFFLGMSDLHAKKVRVIRLNDKNIAIVKVSSRGTVMSFPTKPTNVVLGSQKMFGLAYIQNDIVISNLTPRSRSNMFVYLDGRRFSFDLQVSEIDGDDIVLVRDELESQIKVKIK